MIGNLRKSLGFTPQTIRDIESIRPHVLFTQTNSLVDSLISDIHLVEGIRIRSCNHRVLYGTDLRPIANVRDIGVIDPKLTTSLFGKLIACDEHVDILVNTTTYLNYGNICKLGKAINLAHTEEFGLKKIEPKCDRWFDSWYSIELIYSSLITKDRKYYAVSSTYSSKGNRMDDILCSKVLKVYTTLIKSMTTQFLDRGY